MIKYTIASIFLFAIFLTLLSFAYAASDEPEYFSQLPSFEGPVIKDQTLAVERFVANLSAPTSMEFINKDILVLQKNDGKVLLVRDGILQEKPVLDVNVSPFGETGLLGITSVNSTVYLYFTESENDNESPIANRVYKYLWDGDKLVNPKLVHEFPVIQVYSHVGGPMITDLKGQVYLTIGDMAAENFGREGITLNVANGKLNDIGVIVLADLDNSEFKTSLSSEPEKYFYAIGIRNSFGLTIDPITGYIWDTENGPVDHDEVNLVMPKFNSGWQQIMGPATESQISNLPEFADFKYSDPEFSWEKPVAPTGLTFMVSEKFDNYKNDLLVADCLNGNLYKFKLNSNRTEFLFDDPKLSEDLVLSTGDSMKEIIFGTGFGCITDVKMGPDGLIYIVSHTDGAIYRIIPAAETSSNILERSFINADLQFANLTNANLQFADLNQADLQFANLTNANLQFANLFNINLQGADLTGSNLQGADLTGSNLKHTILDNANLQGANLFGSNLDGSSLRYSNIQNSNLQNATLKSAKLDYANLTNANLENAYLRAAELPHANLMNANLKNSHLSYSNLSNTNLQGANLVGTYYYNADLTGSVFSEETKVDSCFGQDLYNRALARLLRELEKVDFILFKPIEWVIPLICIPP